MGVFNEKKFNITIVIQILQMNTIAANRTNIDNNKFFRERYRTTDTDERIKQNRCSQQ